MFKNQNEVKALVNHLEIFIRAVNGGDETAIKAINESVAQHIGFIAGTVELPVTVTTQNPSSTAVTVMTTQEAEKKTYECPDCKGPMVERTNRSNGDKFYGCTKYPNCKGTRDMEGLSKQERYEKKYKEDKKSAQQDGFTFSKSKPAAVVPEVPEPAAPAASKTNWNPFA